MKSLLPRSPSTFYETNLTGLDCGHSFANRLLKLLNKDITILLVPVAVGGSSSSQWLGDSLHRNVKLMSNFKNRVRAARTHGVIKGILWHQGEADSDTKSISGYDARLGNLFKEFRTYCENERLPILIGELGSFSENQAQWNLINDAIHRYAKSDKNAYVIRTDDLKSKPDKIHFDSMGQRIMGERMAEKFATLGR